jgi:hypothetical protein
MVDNPGVKSLAAATLLLLLLALLLLVVVVLLLALPPVLRDMAICGRTNPPCAFTLAFTHAITLAKVTTQLPSAATASSKSAGGSNPGV